MANRNLQDMLKAAFDSVISESADTVRGSTPYATALNDVFTSIGNHMKVTMGGQNYVMMSSPQIYKGSMDTNVANFKPHELSLSFLSTDGTQGLNIGSTYNNWSGQNIVHDSEEQYRNIYNYLMNMDSIDVTGKMSDDELEYISEVGRAARRNKTYQSIDYSGAGAERAINYVNNNQGPININRNVNTSSADNTPIGRLERLLSGKYKDKMIWANQDFLFGDNFTGDEGFRNKVLDFFSGDGRAEGLRNQMYNRMINLDGYAANSFYYEGFNNMFESYKNLEGLDTQQLHAKMIDDMKISGYSDYEIKQHFSTLKDGAEVAGWDRTSDFYNFDTNLLNNDYRAQVRNGTVNTGSASTPDVDVPSGPKVGDNYRYKGEQFVLTDIGEFNGDPDYTLVSSSGSRVHTSFLDDYELYDGKNKISTKVANNYANKWDELKTARDEFFKNLNDPMAGFDLEKQLAFMKERVDPVVQSLKGYRSRMSKKLGRKTPFSSYDYQKYIKDFAQDTRKSIDRQIKQTQTRQTQQAQQTQQQTQQTQQTTTQANTSSPPPPPPDVEGPDFDIDTGHSNAGDTIDIYDLSPETVANITDEQLAEFAQSADQFEELRRYRDQVRKDLGMDNINTFENNQPDTNTQPETNTNTQQPEINNNFEGGRTGNRSARDQFIDKIIGKQNPGKKTSRVFNYNGKEYAIFDNLEINAKDLSKGITGGRVVDLETNELIEAREAFADINEALMHGDIDSALEKINSFEESKHTFSKDELNERIVNKHTNNTEQQNQNHQESRNRQHNRNQEQQAEQQEEFENSRAEQRQENKDNHAEHTNQNKPDPDTNRPPNTDADNTRTRNNADPDIDTNTSSRRRRRSSRTPKTKTRSIDLKQVIMRSFVDEVIETAEETIDETLENTAKNTAKSKMNWQSVNMKHPDQMDDLEIADLTDEEIKMFANGDKGKIEEWTGRRDKARANKVLDHHMNNSSGDYYSNGEYRNPYQYNAPEMDFEVDADGNTTINKTGKNRTVEVEDNKPFKMQQADKMNQKLLDGAPKNLDDVLDWMKSHKLGMLDIGMNVYGTISTYKESRRQGRGVISSAVRAAADFAIFEMLGPLASFGVQAARTLPGLAIKGVDLLYKENRKMNSAANNQLFGDAQFYDTQQLATMRQSGMEMAKMAQYNLQQTLMGNEATYLHR